MEDMVRQTKMDWSLIANQVGTTRDRVYHWYYETYLRKMKSDKISKQEKMLILKLVVEGIESRKIEEPGF